MYTTKLPHDKAYTPMGKKVEFLYTKEKFKDPGLPAMSRYKGKQFLTTVPKKGLAGYFSQQKHAKEPYNDSAGYLKQQPLDKRKLGFGTHDAKRRDEYCKHFQTEMYREQLKAEAKHMPKAAPRSSKEDGGREASDTTAGLGSTGTATRRFGIMSNTQRDPAVAEALSHYYGTNTEIGTIKRPFNRQKRLGTHVPMSQDFGAYLGFSQPQKPKFGCKSATRHFADVGHVDFKPMF